MFRTIDDFLATWRQESSLTARLFERLTDASLDQRIVNGHRTLGEIAWHIAVSHRSILDHTRLRFDAPSKDMPVPNGAAEICARYVAGAAAVGRAVETQWTDAALRVTDAVYGMMWHRGETLLALVVHEIHHRGQLTVLMRQAGLRLPPIYGPSGDEP
jgi:uncharacterized damage-inducible protein DinB